MVYLRAAKNCNSRYTICGVPQVSSENKGEELSFIEEKEELGGAVLNKESFGGNWELEVQ